MPSPQDRADFTAESFLQLGSHLNHRVLVGVMVASTMMAAIALPRVGMGWALAWLAAVAVAQFQRVRAEAAAARPATGPVAGRLRRRLAIAVYCGVIQGLALAAFPLLDVTERAFFTVVLLGLATGSVANSAGYLPTVIGYGAPLLAPLVVLWTVLPIPGGAPWLGPAMGLLIVFYAAVLHGFAQSAWQIFEESCHIRFQETKLNERLTAALGTAEAANRAKTRFLAAASHDLRQPLHTVVLLASALGLRTLDARSRDIVTLLGEVAETLAAQLDDLLDISKLDAGVVDVQLESVSLAKLLEQHFSEVESVIGAKGLKPRLANGSTGHVRVDAQLFARILRNLTHNAIKFTESGEVSIHSHDEVDEAVVTIRDTGCGIAPEHQQDVFLEFYQAGNPERDRSKGLGLGLSIVDRLCRLLGIAIALRSVPGEGTEFELRLPRVAPPSAVTGAGAAAAQAPRNWGLHVLIVDDERSVRTGMRMLLEELGCTCDEAGSTEQACQLAAACRPDLVLADFRLRGEDSGLRTLEALDGLLGGVTGVLVSGDTAPERLREARNAGRRLLHKPLALPELQQELKSALARRPHRTEGRGDGVTTGAAAEAR